MNELPLDASFHYFQIFIFFSHTKKKQNLHSSPSQKKKQFVCHRKIGDVGWPVGDVTKTSEPGNLKENLRFVLFLGIVLCTRNKLVLRATGDLVFTSSGVSPVFRQRWELLKCSAV